MRHYTSVCKALQIYNPHSQGEFEVLALSEIRARSAFHAGIPNRTAGLFCPQARTPELALSCLSTECGCATTIPKC